MTYIGSSIKQGCNWSVLIYSAESKEMMYGNSTGRKIPSEAVPSLNKYFQSLYGHTLQGIGHCHDRDLHLMCLGCTENCCSSLAKVWRPLWNYSKCSLYYTQVQQGIVLLNYIKVY